MVYPSMMFGSYKFERPEGFQISGDSRVAETQIPRRHGSIIVSPIVLNSRTISIKETLVADNPAGLQTKYDALRTALEAGQDKLYLYDNRYINCVKTSFGTDYERGTNATVAHCTIQFLATDPFVYGSAYTFFEIFMAGLHTWFCPYGVTSVDVECWGAGAGGTRKNPAISGSGGGGGAYSKSTLTVVPGTNYTITVGAGGTGGQEIWNPPNPEIVIDATDGGDTIFDSSLVLAKGGSASAVSQVGGIGGLASSGVGTIKFNGGNGGDIVSSPGLGSGGGGSSAGTGAVGGNGGQPTAGVAPSGGGNGGSGGIFPSTQPLAGNIPGGGTGGQLGNSNTQAPNGADGQVKLTYIGNNMINVQHIIASGTYTITYAGNAPVRPVYTIGNITGVLTSVRISNGTNWFQVSNLTAGDTWVIDSGLYTCTKNGVLDFADFTGNFFAIPAGTLLQTITVVPGSVDFYLDTVYQEVFYEL